MQTIVIRNHTLPVDPAPRAFIRGAVAVLVGLIAVSSGLLIACSELDDSPSKAAIDFWRAIESRDLQAARAVSTAPSERRLDALFGDRIIKEVSFGETLRNERSALVETILEGPVGDTPLEFNTHLERFDRGWRVDAEATASAMRKAGFAAALDDVHEALREGERVMTEVLEHGAREASAALQRALENLEDALGAPVSP